MAGFSWSEEQLNAIYSRNNNYLISAAAGSGKTTVLVERIIRRITDKDDPVPVDRFLVMTFTNAAAAEMKERILNAIEKEVDEQPDNQYLLRQKVLVKNANIMTIDAFCLSMLRANFDAADIDPGFEICDDADNKIIQDNVFNMLLDQHLYRYYNGYKEEESSFFAMLKKYGGNNGVQLFEHVNTINKEMDSRPFPNEWLKNAVSIYSDISHENFEDCTWVHFIKEDTLKSLKMILSHANNLLMYIESMPGADACYKTINNDVETLSELYEESEQASYDDLLQLLLGFKFKTAVGVKANTADAEIKEYVYKLRDNYKELFKRASEVFKLGNSDSIISDMNSMAVEVKAFADFVLEYRECYFNEKKKRNAFTFADIESLCLKILIKHDEEGKPIVNENGFEYTDIAHQYSKSFAEILVDEYQDSNDLQEVLINALASKDQGNVFMVGDVKQSIYRFRQSNPKLFIDKFNTYTEYTGAEDQNNHSQGKKIVLDRNYRSANGVLEGINDVFMSIMKPDSGEIDYNEKEALKPGRGLVNENEPDIEVHIINHKEIKGDLEENYQIVFEKAMIEADLMVSRLKELVEGDRKKGISPLMVTDKDGTKRPAQYGDVAVLLRSFKNVSAILEDTFLNAGIPVSVDAVSEYFYRSEINTVLSALQVVLNSQDDLSMLSLMRSTLYKFSAEDIAKIRTVSREGNMYKSMCCYVEANYDHTAIKTKQLLEDIARWKELEKIYTISELIWYFYESTGFYDMSALMSEGKRRQANLRILFEKAHAFEQTKFSTLSGFIDYIDNLKDAEISFVDAEATAEMTDAVRVMSIHKSKGLEFPIVFIMSCEKEFNQKDLSNFLVVQNDFGIGILGGNSDKSVKWETPLRAAIKKKIQFELYSEEMRILYVAMTRAKEKLIMSGCIAKPEQFFDNIQLDVESCLADGNELSAQTVMSYKSYISWVCCTLCFKYLSDFVDLTKRLMSFEETDGRLNDIWSLHYHDAIAMREIFESTLTAENSEVVDNDSKLDSFVAQALSIDVYSGEFGNLADNMNWKYKKDDNISARIKISVSELVSEVNSLTFLEDEGDLISEKQDIVVPLYVKPSTDRLAVPTFGGEKHVNKSIRRGLAYHTLVEHMDYLAGVENERYFEFLKSQMVERELLTEEDAEITDVGCLQRFSKTNLYKRICNAYSSGSACFRERPFLMEYIDDEVADRILDATVGINETALAHLKSKNGVFIQGVIDLFFVENGEIVLVDFKTNKIKDGEETLRKKYEIQFLMYKYALERITGMRVKEGHMCLLTYSGNEIKDNCIRMF